MPLINIAGSERFAYQLKPSAQTRELARGLTLHSVSDDDVAGVDPLTYEVIRHRLASIAGEMGDALKRMSGSVVVTDCNDFGATILDECGDSVIVGLYNTQLAASVDMAVKWTLENRGVNPGIRPGDMFFCNDPWIGGGLHQNDATIMAPLFHEGELFGWTAAVCHQVDLGGVSPGSWSVEGRDVFWESTPVPPVKIVEEGEIRSDIEDMYLRRSRVPRLIALDLRAKIGANNIAQERLTQLIAKYSAKTVKAVMKRMMNDAESRLRAKLLELPDGEWSGVAHQDSFRSGDRNVYKITLKMTKKGDRLTFDFTGTDKEVEGFANCTLAGLRGGIMPIVLTMLCGDIPWAPGGLYRCFDIISEPGTINNCNFPAGIGKASVASAWATQNVVSETVGTMLSIHPEHRKSLMCVCCGTWDLALLAGLDQRGNPFVTMICDSMAGGMGARVDQDGVDTGGLNCIPMGRVADVEINEFSFPMLYLWRREEMDSGGAGRFRGGAGGSSCFIPYDSPIGGVHLVVSATGKALPQATGLSGGYPAGTQYDVLLRDTNARQMLAAGRIPGALDDLQGTAEVLQQHLETHLNDGDVYFTHWQGGGGYGDPLLRNPILVARDVVRQKVSRRAAIEVYGVALAENGTVDVPATEAARKALREKRAAEAFH
ncbi:MAG TPA: hydantoinase B/oxoprolinase family protein [Eoetvoesiella sp.]|uniref:hydantoinase B/oxoprolinase family protein n=1 Tax=Eoetvoesiella sp. TaxID=1966355 RepID=UPI002BFA3EFD|nr:hydantoinase B/oxoprolinase family protein [Eoetvoesiella sp.]HWK61473.1 hydantoinase B/oxoprolinase family protein [Eoetvoesiella sp.]